MWGIIQRNESIAFEWLVNCGRRSATARVVHLLLETAARSRVDLAVQPLKIPFTQKQIAQITGQTAVNVNRVFADLQRLSLVERKGREMTFKRLRELEKIADFDPNYLAFPTD
jgi:CRP-like cAMP-binding protein